MSSVCQLMCMSTAALQRTRSAWPVLAQEFGKWTILQRSLHSTSCNQRRQRQRSYRSSHYRCSHLGPRYKAESDVARTAQRLAEHQLGAEWHLAQLKGRRERAFPCASRPGEQAVVLFACRTVCVFYTIFASGIPLTDLSSLYRVVTSHNLQRRFE